MRTISVLNPKGGCGKTTLATSLASYYAMSGVTVALADLDPQNSSSDWLATRPDDAPYIEGLGVGSGVVRAKRGTDVLIIDAPAATYGKTLSNLLRRSQTVLIPIVPSPIDIRAVQTFLDELVRSKLIVSKRTRVGLIANRVNERTLISKNLALFLGGYKLPVITTLRDSQNYIRAMSRGLGILDLPPHLTDIDTYQWKKLTRWLHRKSSMPAIPGNQ